MTMIMMMMKESAYLDKRDVMHRRIYTMRIEMKMDDDETQKLTYRTESMPFHLSSNFILDLAE